MPNQLSQQKRRTTLAEHRAVLVALDEIARREDTTVTALLRRAARALVKDYAADPEQAVALRKAVRSAAPELPAQFRTAAQLARFKRQQRVFDRLLLELGLDEPWAIQQRNSVIPSAGSAVRILELRSGNGATGS